VHYVLGIDLACRAAHQASLARADGTFVWSGRKFFTRTSELEDLWSKLALNRRDTLTVVLEPTRNAWVPIAAWFRRRNAQIVMVPTSQSSDLRAYYAKHTKNDRLDSRLLARLPLLHPDGLHEHAGLGPGEPLRRAVKVRSSLVKRRTAVYQRIDAQLEMLGPAWHEVLGSSFGKCALALLTRYADPRDLQRLGHARLARFLIRHSRGAWREAHATALLAAARESIALWGPDGLDFAELAADIAVEAEQAAALTEQIEDLEERIAGYYEAVDPDGIVASAPGVGPVNSSVIAGRLGDIHRFRDLAAVRSYSGMVPKVNQSGQSEHHGGLAKTGDSLLREALFSAADTARRIDPQLAAKYARLINSDHHHDSAICHIATTLLTRIAACWRAGTPYVLRDLDGTPITPEQGKVIVTGRFVVERRKNTRTGREQKESPGAPASRPATGKSRKQAVSAA
jgi:transposase